MRDSLDTDFFDLPRPRVIAHRGLSGEFPENTMLAFQRAVDIGVPYIELDVHMTRDGEFAVHHDPELSRTCGLAGAIGEMIWEEVASADPGFNFPGGHGEFPFRACGLKIPRLAEVLGCFPRQRFIVEIKQEQPDVAGPLLRLIRSAAMGRHVLIASEHGPPLAQVRVLAPSIPTGMCREEVAAFILSQAAGANECPGDALQIPPEYEGIRLVSESNVARAHALGIEVHVWTVNEPAMMRDLLAMGVDGIITDFAGRMLPLARSLHP